jgi:glucose-1-phosphate adenylyltransferase
VRINRSIVSEGTMLEECTVEELDRRRADVDDARHRRRSLIMGSDPYPPEGPAAVRRSASARARLIQDAIIDKNARIGRNVRISNKTGVGEADGPGGRSARASSS